MNSNRGMRGARALFLVAALCTPLLARGDGLFGAPGGVSLVPEVELHRILFELDYSDGLSAGHLLAELGALGPAAVGALFDALHPEGAAEEQAAQVAAGAALEGWRRAELERALRAIPAAVLRDGDEAEGRPHDTTAAQIALAVLERVGEARDLPLFLALADPGALDARPERELSRALEGALTGLFARESATYTELQRHFREIHPALQPVALRALGAAGTRAALDLLAEFLGDSPTLDLTLLTQVNRVTSHVGQPYDWSFLLRVRTYLAANDPALRREAALAAGRMEDVEAFREVLELLHDESVGVRENAYWALCAMSGRKLPRTFERAQRWYASELDWWNLDAPRLLAAVGTGTDVERVHALADLSSHRLFRHELARELMHFLDRPEPEILRLVCSSLASLGSSTPVPKLIGLLDHEDLAVRRQAWQSLRMITGFDLPESAQSWAPLLPG